MFTNAIVRKPGKSLINGLSSADLGKPDFSLALKQHAIYVEALRACGLDVLVLDADEAYPDSTFVEDTALLTSECAIIMRPGALSRRGEVDSMQAVIQKYYPSVERVTAPGTVEAGDIMMVENDFYIGLSERTNRDGAQQVVDFLSKVGYRGQIVHVGDMLHFKSGIAFLEDNTFVAVSQGIDLSPFQGNKIIFVDTDESYAANCLWVNGTVLVAKGFPNTLERIQAAGYPTIELEMSEFRKLDGGLSCLSLRF
jgi:dimethylargininase